MRITQSMLSNNMLRNLSNSYNKMGKLQDQLSSGTKLTRPSDDPVAAAKGMGYRTTLTKNEQFSRNMGEVSNWLDTSDQSLSEVNSTMQRVQELVTQAASDTNTDDDRQKIKVEIDQIRQQIRNVANSQVGDKYIFSGTNTLEPLFKDPAADADAGQIATLPGNNNKVEIEVYNGVTLAVNTDGKALFSDIDNLMEKVQSALSVPTSGTAISNLLGDINNGQSKILASLADIGAKQNRVEMMTNRLDLQNGTITSQMSDNEDVQYEKTISDFITQESVQRAALSAGAKIIQPTLTDFLR